MIICDKAWLAIVSRFSPTGFFEALAYYSPPTGCSAKGGGGERSIS
jgi:hypothetical protein